MSVDRRGMTDREIDRAVADAIGWKCNRWFQLPDPHAPGSGGGTCTREKGYLKHGAHTWARMQTGKYREQEYIPCDHFPFYFTDPGTAFSLVAALMDGMVQPYFELRTCGVFWTALLVVGSERTAVTADGAAPSEAIARLALARHKGALSR